MSFTNQMKKKILENSDSYNSIKNENELLKNKLKIESDNYKELNKKLDSYKNEIQNLKDKINNHEEILNNNHQLLNILFIDFELKPKCLLKNIQVLCQETLNFIVNVCKKHDLDYWLIGGNLLGAVRHEGFIPWDDDIDIGMLRKDFNKFNRVTSEEIELNNLDDFVKLKINPLWGENLIHAFTKVDCVIFDDTAIAGVDVFPYDLAKNNNLDRNEFRNFRDEIWTRLIQGEDEEKIFKDYYEKFNLDYDDGDYILPNPTVLNYFLKNIEELFYWDKNKIFPLNEIKFNGKYYNCPRDPHHFLSAEYSNYMEIPINSNFQHQNTDKLKNIENINDYLEECIPRLKKANENFKF